MKHMVIVQEVCFNSTDKNIGKAVVFHYSGGFRANRLNEGANGRFITVPLIRVKPKI